MMTAPGRLTLPNLTLPWRMIVTPPNAEDLARDRLAGGYLYAFGYVPAGFVCIRNVTAASSSAAASVAEFEAAATVAQAYATATILC